MITDSQVMEDIRPDEATDRMVVRNIDGNIRLQRVLRNLPDHWQLEHIISIGGGVMTAVFSRNPQSPVEGDFDYFAP